MEEPLTNLLATLPATQNLPDEERKNYRVDVDVGSKSWAGRIRHRARVLAEQVETGYLELGEILYRIYDAPVDGDPKNGSVLAKWGYSNIGEFAEKELSLHYKKAQRLVRIFYRVEVELNGLGQNPELKRRFIRLGWSKARELVRVLTTENMVAWIDRAETVNYTTLVEVIKRAVAIDQARQIQSDLARQPDPIELSNAVPAGLLPVETLHEDHGTSLQDSASPSAVRPSTRPVGDYADTTSETFVDRKWVSKVFQLESGQAETVNLALKRAQELIGQHSKAPSTLISLICLEFLSGADWSGTSVEQRLRFLAKIEKSIGLRLVVVDDDDEVVYGLGALAAAAKAARVPATEIVVSENKAAE